MYDASIIYKIAGANSILLTKISFTVGIIIFFLKCLNICNKKVNTSLGCMLIFVTVFYCFFFSNLFSLSFFNV